MIDHPPGPMSLRAPRYTDLLAVPVTRAAPRTDPSAPQSVLAAITQARRSDPGPRFNHKNRQLLESLGCDRAFLKDCMYFEVPDRKDHRKFIATLLQSMSFQTLLTTGFITGNAAAPEKAQIVPPPRSLLVPLQDLEGRTRGFARLSSRSYAKEREILRPLGRKGATQFAFPYHVALSSTPTDDRTACVTLGVIDADLSACRHGRITFGLPTLASWPAVLETAVGRDLRALQFVFPRWTYGDADALRHLHDFAAACRALGVTVSVGRLSSRSKQSVSRRREGDGAPVDIDDAVRKAQALILPEKPALSREHGVHAAARQFLALGLTHPNAYTFHGQPVCLSIRTAGQHAGGPGLPEIQPFTAPVIAAYAAEVAHLKRSDLERASLGLLNGLLQTPGRIEGRVLNGLVTTPMVDAEGHLARAPGYLPKHRAVYWPTLDNYLVVPPDPTVADARSALRYLTGIFEDLPFATLADRSAWIATLLTPFAVWAIDGEKPLPYFEGDRTTVSILAHLLGVLVQGQPVDEIRLASPEVVSKQARSVVLRGARLALVALHACDNPQTALVDAGLTDHAGFGFGPRNPSYPHLVWCLAHHSVATQGTRVWI